MKVFCLFWAVLLQFSCCDSVLAQKPSTQIEGIRTQTDTTRKKKGFLGGLFSGKKKKKLDEVAKEKDKISSEKNQLAKQNEDLTEQLDNLDYQKQILKKQQVLLDSQVAIQGKNIRLMSEVQAKTALYLLQQKRLYDSLAHFKTLDSLLVKEQRAALTQQEDQIKRQEAESDLQRSQRNLFIAITLVVLFAAIGIYNRMANAKKYSKLIETEKNRAEALLLNILPAETAEELKTNGVAKARHYEQVSVLFSDFVGFTNVAEQLSPQALVAELDFCFRGFDAIVDKHKIEKIKTIGDAYMAVGGLPTPDLEVHIRVIRAAMDMQTFIEKRKVQRSLEGLPFFESRIGIHTGELVAGVVGDKKFAFDVWGDTVNIAARVEATSLPGRVNISDDTYQRIKHQFFCEPRGKQYAKNKGEMEMYFVEKEKM